MAASTPTKRLEDFKEEFLTCCICAETYDNGEHQAKCLPCLHTFCKACLQSHAGGQLKFNCPNCHTVVTLPGKTIDSLPSNFIVENLKEYKGIFNLKVSCGGCDDGNPGVSFCHDCGCFQCQACVDNHHKMRLLRNHKLSTMTELQENKHNPMMKQQQQCKKHPKQDLNLYCQKEDCKVLVCASCGHVDHQGHDLVDLGAAIDEIVAGMQQSSARVNDRNQEMTRKLKLVETMKKKLTNNFKQKEKDMQESVQTLHNKIDSQYNKAHTNLKHMYETEINLLTTSIKSIDFLTVQMNSACEFANHACGLSHPTQLLTAQKQIMERLHVLENTDLPEPTFTKTDFAFTATCNHHSAMSQIQESLQHLCDVDWLKEPQISQGGKRNVSHHSSVMSQIQGSLQHLRDVHVDWLKEPHISQGGNGNVKSGQVKSVKGKPRSSLPQSKPQVDVCQCTITWLLGNAIVLTVDTKGHQMTTGGSKVEIRQDVQRKLSVRDNNDGTYSFKYNPFGPLVHVTINDSPMKGSPFKPNKSV